MLNDGEGRIRGMITFAGNPVLSTPNGTKLDAAFQSLEFMVSIDSYVNETTRHADIILPPVSPLERDHYDLVFRILAVRNTARYAPAVFDPPPDSNHDWEILHELNGRLHRLRHGRRFSFSIRQWLRYRFGPRGLLALAFQLGKRNFKRRYGRSGMSLKELIRNPHGIDLGPLQPCLPGRLPKQQKHVDLAPSVLVKDVARLHAQIKGQKSTKDFLLIGRRDLRSNNSWMHNSSKLMSGKGRCFLFMNPTDADRMEIHDLQRVRITSNVGSVETSVKLTDEIMPGVASLPHGFGHHRPGIKLRVAQQNAGVSINDLTDDNRIDELCGNAAFCGEPVDVRPV